MNRANALTCSKCGSTRVHRSRARGRLEELRKYFTVKRLHRCHACGRRSWEAVMAPIDTATSTVDCEPLDMTLLDRQLADQSELQEAEESTR